MKILGLDLGVGSVGWSLIEIDNSNNPVRILGMGSRIIGLSSTESDNFTKGKGETTCSERTARRTARKGLDRFQMRRKALMAELSKHGMIVTADMLLKLSPLELWQLRADAATEGHKLSLPEIGRVLLHINQRRGYRHAKSDEGDAKQKSYVAEVNGRYAKAKELGMTPGQFFASLLKASERATEKGCHVCDYRIKNEVFPRRAYQEEFDRIMQVQREFYPEVLTDEVVKKLRSVIFYQRPLKSCKRLVSICEFESHNFISRYSGKMVTAGPKVTPRTSPIAQETRIWEAVNNIRLKNLSNKKRKADAALPINVSSSRDYRMMQYEYELNYSERQKVFDYLNTHEKLSSTELLKLLGLKKSDGFRWEGAPKNGLEGNKTYTQLRDALGSLADDTPDILRFRIEYEDTDKVDVETGEVLQGVKMLPSGASNASMRPQYQDEPLYRLWHTVYSSHTRDELAKAMEKQFGITDPEVIDNLYRIDFVKAGYANKSAKFMRKLLPYLKEGYMYSEACTMVGVNHSDSLTTEENAKRVLQERLENLPKGALRQPVVEKILNQMINIVNALLEQYGEIDEIRVELARELKQSKEQRQNVTFDIARHEKENLQIAAIIASEGLPVSRRNIQKYRLWEESGMRCIYCGKTLGMTEFLGAHDAEVEHIIPRSVLFDDSMTNKVCSCRKCNQDKGNLTAYDFMSAKSEGDFQAYVARVEDLYKDQGGISKAKRDRLMMSLSEIPQDFLERDLRQTQYISKKAREILSAVCRNVYASSGKVTDFFRHFWGYDNILHDLNLERYQLAGLVEEVEVNHKGQTHRDMRIKEWSKRMDHRHHAIDALVVALTRQGYIQRLNNLNAERGNIYDELKSSGHTDMKHLLEKWAESRPHFSVSEVSCQVDGIAVSIKAGKKLCTPGKRYIYKNGRRKAVQQGLTVPRGALHQETVYGKIKLQDPEADLKYAFENPGQIVDPRMRQLVQERIKKAGGDPKKALRELKKKPLFTSVAGTLKEIKTINCFRDVFATRSELASLSEAGISRIVDKEIREEALARLRQCGNLSKFKQSLDENPIMRGGSVKHPVRRVRVYANDSLIPLRKDAAGRPIAFAMSGNNHHVALYEKEGKIVETVITAWIAIKRKLAGLPVIVNEPDKARTLLASLPENYDKQEITQSLPPEGSRFITSLKMGDMCLLALSPEEISAALAAGDKKTLARHLYRVQKLTAGDYYFRLNTWTSVDAKKESVDKAMKALFRTGIQKLINELNLTPVKVDNLGRITLIKQ